MGGGKASGMGEICQQSELAQEWLKKDGKYERQKIKYLYGEAI